MERTCKLEVELRPVDENYRFRAPLNSCPFKGLENTPESSEGPSNLDQADDCQIIRFGNSLDALPSHQRSRRAEDFQIGSREFPERFNQFRSVGIAGRFACNNHKAA